MPGRLGEFAAVIFDFDGTLADSYAAIAASVNHVRQRHGLNPLSVEEVKTHVGRAAPYLLSKTVPLGDLEDNLTCYRAHHPGVMQSLTTLLPGAFDLLGHLKQAGKKVALCSNKPRLFSEGLLEYLQVAVHFDAILGPEDVAHPKPAPDMLIRAVERLGVRREQALYVGDMTVDIDTARAAGVCVWIVPTGCESRESLLAGKPDRLLNDLQDLVAEIQKA
jgi:2-phosphoglycolate phosphatase